MKGRWIETMQGNSYVRKCSVCGAEFPMGSAPHNFCGNCGKDMRRPTNITLKDFLSLGYDGSWIVVIYDPEEEKLPFNGYLEDFQDTGDYIVDSWEVAETLNEDNGDDCSELWIYVEKPKLFEHEGYMVSEPWDV